MNKARNIKRFINEHGFWLYKEGHYVKRNVHGKTLTFFRISPTGEEYPEDWVKEQLTENEKAEFTVQYNETFKRNCKVQKTIHHEDEELFEKFVPLTFEEIIELYANK